MALLENISLEVEYIMIRILAQIYYQREVIIYKLKVLKT